MRARLFDDRVQARKTVRQLAAGTGESAIRRPTGGLTIALRTQAVASGDETDSVEMDDDQASASARSARASLLHRSEDGSDAVAIGFHVAFPADAEPAEVAQPGKRSFHHPAHAAGSRVVGGAAAGDHRFTPRRHRSRRYLSW
jgi:hypothetical protein